LSEKTILLVGHCVPDEFMLRSAIRSIVPGANVVKVKNEGALQEHLASADLALVNRVLDGRFESDDGIGLIASLAPESSAKFMLVSNFADAQARAEAAGAVPGFGKSDMRSEETRRRVEAALA